MKKQEINSFAQTEEIANKIVTLLTGLNAAEAFAILKMVEEIIPTKSIITPEQNQ